MVILETEGALSSPVFHPDLIKLLWCWGGEGPTTSHPYQVVTWRIASTKNKLKNFGGVSSQVMVLGERQQLQRPGCCMG